MESGEREPIASWGQNSHGCGASLDPGNHPREGEEGFLVGSQKEVCGRPISTYDPVRSWEVVVPSLAKHIIHTFATLCSLIMAMEGP